MSNNLEASLEAVKLPAELVGACSIATENGLENQLVGMTPISNTGAHRRLRAACIILRSVIVFSQARDGAAENQNKLLDNPLQPPQETVVPVKPDCIADLARLKNVQLLNQLGGVEGVALDVGADSEKGIQGDDGDIARRRLVYGSNTIQKRPPKLIHILFEAIWDPIIIVLLPCAALALGFGIKHHGKGGLSDGVSIFLAVLVVVSINAFSNLWSKRQLFKLPEARNDFNNISILRNGQHLSILASEAVVGDVVFLKTGDQIPADGLYIDGDSLLVDDSNVRGHMVSVEVIDSNNPFLLSGTKAINGSARMLVTAVGKNTEWGEKLSLKSCHSDQSTPLQKRLHELSRIIAIIGSTIASIVLVVLLIRYFSGNLHDDNGVSHFTAGKTRCLEAFDDVLGILATPIAIASTAIPEGLLQAFLISIAFSIKRMTTRKALVRNHSAFEVIGATTVICTDEKSLTSNSLAVTEFRFGDKVITGYPCLGIPQNVIEVLCQVVFLTHTEASSLSPSESPDNQIENAIQEWGVRDLSLNVEQVRQNYAIHLPETFHADRSQSFAWITNKNDNSLHVHQKGEAEAILPICSQYFDENGNIKDMAQSSRESQEKIILEMKSRGLQCVAFAYKNMSEQPADEDEKSDDTDGYSEPKHRDECLIFIGLVGLKNPCLPEVKKAVEDCKKAGVDIKIVTRTDLLAATATAVESGILEANSDIMTTGEVVDGPNFRAYSDDERLEKSLGIRVLARASTMDKLRLVQCLKEKGEVVAVTGYTTGDAIVLSKADVGLSLGTQGTQQAKANSDVILIEDHFHSLVRALTYSRAMYHKIQLYAQFLLTVSTSNLVVDFVTAIFAREPPTFKIVTAISSGKVLYATIQVLWVKLIVGVLAAVAITVEEPAEELRQLPNVERDQPVITSTMWKNIVGQAVYPVIILLTIQFQGQSIINLDSRAKETMIFNIFVLWLLCVMLKNKGVERNLFEGMWRSKLLWGIVGLIILLQVLIVELLHKFAGTKPLTLKQWMLSIAIAVPAWPIGWLIEKMVSSAEAFLSIASN